MNESSGRIKVKNHILTILLPKEIDDHVAYILRSELDRQISIQDIRELVFDFAETEFMDSSGIGMILGRYKKMQFMKGSVKVVNASDRILGAMEMSGLHKIIKIERGSVL